MDRIVSSPIRILILLRRTSITPVYIGFARKPEVVLWNLQRLAEALMPISKQSELSEALQNYEDAFVDSLYQKFIERLGVVSQGDTSDGELVNATCASLKNRKLHYYQFFFDWYGGRASQERALRSPVSNQYSGAAFQKFVAILKKYLSSQPERLQREYSGRQKPSMLLIDEIEAI